MTINCDEHDLASKLERGKRKKSENLRSIQTVIDLLGSWLGLGASIMSPTLSQDDSASDNGVNRSMA